MTHKRIFIVQAPSAITATASVAKKHGWLFRAAKNGGNDEFVLEGPAQDAKLINRLVAFVGGGQQ
jgi:hypothetical protein